MLDYSNSQIISINSGRGKIQEGNFKLIHVIELENHQNFMDRMHSILKEEITTVHPLYPYLNHELNSLQTLLDGLKPHKTKRSLNFIGTAWKWIAGNPDHEDFEIIKSKINNVLENNNKQVIINQMYNDRINNITKMANMITNAIHKENHLTDQLALNIQYKLRLMKEEITNIKYAIHWAKAGVINSLILSDSEIRLAIQAIEKDNLPYATPEEALDFANIKIISNKLCLLYIIYIPLTTIELYDKLLLKAVKKNQKIIEIDHEHILKNHNKIYGIISNCKTINSLSICNQKNVLDISNTSCLPNLLNSRPSKCHQTNSQHIPSVEEISEGVILLNQYDGEIIINSETQKLNGTYLIKFSNSSIKIDNMKFIATEKSAVQALPAILQHTPEEDEYREIMSVQLLKDLNIENTKTIELLQQDTFRQQAMGIGTLSISVIITIFIIIIIINRNRTLQINNSIKSESSDKANHQNSNESIESEVIQMDTTTNVVPKAVATAPQRRKFYDTAFF